MPKRIPVEAPPVPFERHVPGIAYGVLDELVGYAIRRAQLKLLETFEQLVGDTKFTTQRFGSLVIIEQNPGLTQTRLGEILGIARSGVMLLIDFHEAAGNVAREPSTTDRRAYGLRITPAGKRRLAEVKRRVREVDRRSTAALTATEKRQLVALLEKIGEPAPRASRRRDGTRRPASAAGDGRPR